jgi:hypothetical protein
VAGAMISGLSKSLFLFLFLSFIFKIIYCFDSIRYHLRIYSVQDPHVFSRSSEFRITMPYGFYP